MGETIPPESKSQPASARDEDPHESVTIAPPAPNFDEILRQPPLPSLSHRSDLHFRAALDAGTRAGFSLAELSKMVEELGSGVVGAKQANEQLVQELSTLRAMLGSANEQQLGLKHRIAELEQEISTVRAEAEQQQQFLTDQHDDFLAGLIEEHEEALSTRDFEGDTRRMGRDVSDLAQKLVQTESARLQSVLECQRAREALAKAQAQRDEAQARAHTRERERDELRAESSMLRARLGMMRSATTTPPPAVVSSRPPSFHLPPALELDSGELDSTLHARPSARRPPIPSRHTPPPELERAVYTARPASVTPVPGSDRAKEFPRHDTRPGVGGPKPSEPPPPPSFGPAPSGWTPPPPPPEQDTTAPPPRPRSMSAASIPPSQVPKLPALKQKPDASSRPLISYSLGEDGVRSETLEGARVSSKPPRK